MIFAVSDHWSYTTGAKSSLKGIDNSTRSLSPSHSLNKSSELFSADVSRNCRRNNNRAKLMTTFPCCNDTDNDLIRDLASTMSAWRQAVYMDALILQRCEYFTSFREQSIRNVFFLLLLLKCTCWQSPPI